MRIGVLILIGFVALPLSAQEKPRVFVAPNAAWRTHKDLQNQTSSELENRTVEISSNFVKSCKDVSVNVDLTKADYVVELNRRTVNAVIKITRTDITVYRMNGDLVGGAAKSSVGAAVKAACAVIKKDWPAKGRETPRPAVKQAAPTALLQ